MNINRMYKLGRYFEKEVLPYMKKILLFKTHGRECCGQFTYRMCSVLFDFNATSFSVSSVTEFLGEELKLTKISRNEMGVYLCIASNGVPPAVSKRIYINVHCE